MSSGGRALGLSTVVDALWYGLGSCTSVILEHRGCVPVARHPAHKWTGPFALRPGRVTRATACDCRMRWIGLVECGGPVVPAHVPFLGSGADQTCG